MPGTHHGLLLVRLPQPGREALFQRLSTLFLTEDVGTLGPAASSVRQQTRFGSGVRHPEAEAPMPDEHEIVATDFDIRAANYSRNQWHRVYAERLVAHASIAIGDRVLDAGVGTGFAALAAAERWARAAVSSASTFREACSIKRRLPSRALV